MEFEEQKLVLSAFLSNRDLLAVCNSIIKPEYFAPELRKAAKFIQDYFAAHRDIPRAEVVRAKTGIQLTDDCVSHKSEIEFLSAEIEKFCQNEAMTAAVLKAPELIGKRDYGKVLELLKSAVSVGLSKDLGLDYFDNPLDRLKRTLVDNPRISTGWPELDALTNGLDRQELIIFAANSGGGKSMTMLNLGKNLLSQGLGGVYISLEMSEATVSKRLDSMISHIAQDALLKNMETVAAHIAKKSHSMGKFLVKRMPENSTNVNTIRSYLRQLEQQTGFVPDFIIIDYIDIMGTTMSVDAGNLFVKDKYVTEEIRALGHEFNAIMISASQLGRTAIDAEKLNQAHIQGGISKINTSDSTIGIKQDDLMRAAGEISFEALKVRNASRSGSRALLAWDPISLNISSKGQVNLSLQKPASKPLNVNSTVFAGKTQDTSDLMQV